MIETLSLMGAGIVKTWLHVKSGRRYVEIGRGPLSVSVGPGLQENDRVVAYRPEMPAGTDIYFRGEREFDDGRFLLVDKGTGADEIAVKIDVLAAADAGHRLDEARRQFIQWALSEADLCGGSYAERLMDKAVEMGVAERETYDREIEEGPGDPWVTVLVAK